MSGYVKLADKCLRRHSDQHKRMKIARAKLREQVTGRLTQAQRLLLETMVPIALELDAMAQQYGEPGFDMRLYVDLQSTFRQSFERLQIGTKRKAAQASQNAHGCDLGAILG